MEQKISNFLQINSKLLYDHYMYIDTKDDHFDKLVKIGLPGVHVVEICETLNEKYQGVLCKVNKTDRTLFENIMEKLQEAIVNEGNDDYLQVCNEELGQDAIMKDALKKNYLILQKFSLLYQYFAYVDTPDYASNQLMVNGKIGIRFMGEGRKGDEPYIVVVCKVRKRDIDKFYDIMENLKRKMLLTGHRDYPAFCEKLIESTIEKVAELRETGEVKTESQE